MRSPSTSRHVYKKIHELEDLVESVKQFNLVPTWEKFFDDDEINNSMNDVFKSVISFGDCCSRVDSILTYLERFKLNSKQEIKVKYLKEVFLKEVEIICNKLNEG